MTEREKLLHEFNTKGFVVIPSVLSSGEIQKLKSELEVAIEKESQFHGGTSHKDHGMVLVCPMYGKSFVDLAGNAKAMDFFNAVMGEGCIVYAFTSSSMPPSKENYSTRVHIDCPRFIPGYITNMGGIFLLDDFTEENGATYFLPGSHLKPDEPTEEDFFKNAVRLKAPAGSACYFHGRLWHSGGKNSTQKWRHAVTINMCRSYMKQRLDLPRLLGPKAIEGATPLAAQKLGYWTRIPSSLEEYYLPPDKRLYKQKTE
jgi:ectoine hydroxylase-related dioxygenase (phytanoyl-CoA dioxygenase family)